MRDPGAARVQQGRCGGLLRGAGRAGVVQARTVQGVEGAADALLAVVQEWLEAVEQPS